MAVCVESGPRSDILSTSHHGNQFINLVPTTVGGRDTIYEKEGFNFFKELLIY